jgi:F420-non-reducing hydrogenase large subunit
MAFRAFDPCYSCATHTLPGQMPLEAHIHQGGQLVKTLKQNL